MSYTPPPLSELLLSAGLARSEYLLNNTNVNPERLKRFDILDVLIDFIKQIHLNNNGLPEDELRDILLGAWFFARRGVVVKQKRYKLLDPEFSEGIFGKSGSRFHTSASRQLHLSSTNACGDIQQLIYLEKFYSFIFDNQKSLVPFDSTLIKRELTQRKLNVETLSKEIRAVMKNLLSSVDADVKSLVKAHPTEESIHYNMSHLHDQYAKNKLANKTRFFSGKSQNPEHDFYAQLAEAMADYISTLPEEKALENHVLTRKQRIEHGTLLFIMWSVSQKGMFSSASDLLKLCLKILNVDKLYDIDSKEIEDCVTTFKTCLRDNAALTYLENYGVQHFDKNNLLTSIDTKIDKMFADIEKMQKDVSGHIKTNWPARDFFGWLFSLPCRYIGFGIGAIAGATISDSQTTVGSKVSLGKALNFGGTAILGLTRGYLGFLAADFIIQSALMRAFGKVLENAGRIVGYTTGGVFGFGVDLTAKGIHNFCAGVLKFHNQYPMFISDADIAVVRCLHNLPDELLEPAKKQRLDELTAVHTETTSSTPSNIPTVEDTQAFSQAFKL